MSITLSTTYQHLRLEIRGGIAVVTLDRPPVNALVIDCFRELASAFAEIDQASGVGVAILTGAGRCFCAGRDLKIADSEPPEVRSRLARAAWSAVYHARVPVIGAMNGPAMGAGCELAMLCDIIVASDRAVFALPEVDANANPSVAMLLRGLNQYQARAMAFIGERVGAAEMQRLGVVRRVVPHEDLLTAALELANVLAAKSPLALRAARWSANEVEAMFTDFELAYRAIESRVSIQLLTSDDHKEASAAFAEKRAPVFTGR